MAKLPVLKPHEVVSCLEVLGFVEVRQRGAHKQFRHVDGRGTTVPFHNGRDISPILLRQIARDIDMSAEDLLTARDYRPRHADGRAIITPLDAPRAVVDTPARYARWPDDSCSA